ncbi:MAG: hypothetical protein IJN54_10295 [Lachnospiraceae bacterium]|nr:hypothetical protein [Lachnospiraceae bacterium]
MNQIIDRLLNGDFDYERGSLDFSCPRLELVINKGEILEDCFTVYGFPNKLTKGYITTSDMRMECLTPEFAGSEEQIRYRFHSEGLEEGAVVKGEFYVISNQGEYYLPYVVTVAHRVLDSSLGGIKNLFHFANLAKSNMEEAMQLFYSPDFKQILTGNDRQYLKVYEGLSKYKGNGQNLEEFLLVINKKQKTEYLLEESHIRVENPEGISEGKISITKNGWGYTFLNIETEGDFLSVEKEELSDDDFLGNYCKLSYYIDADRLHAGKNYGSIRLYSAYVDITAEVVVINGESHRMKKIREREKKRTICQIMKYYQALRLKKIGTAVWLSETQKEVENLLAFNEDDISARLFQAQLLITKERFNEAKWILDRISNYYAEEVSEPVLYSYYLYLTTLYHREEQYVNEVAAVVEQIYRENEGNWRIAWLLLYLSEEYSKSAQKKWIFLEEQFRYNCKSPVIYAEAAMIVLANPAILMKLGEFEIQVLNYMAKQEVLTAEVTVQVRYLIQNAKEYKESLFYLLKVCYEVNPNDEILLTICTILMKGGRSGKKYFPWYQAAVEKEMRITKLYEYYMMSIDLEYDKPIPKTVAMYFSYHSDLDYERNAFLYANVHKNRESFPEVYKAYTINIEKFVEEQILKGHINRNLAYLYKNLLTPRMLNEEMANALAKLLFMHQIEVEQRAVRWAVVYYARMAEEIMYPVINGKVQIPLYDNDYTLLFEDDNRNRYQISTPYIMEKFMLPGKVAKVIAPLVTNQLGYATYICECSNHFVAITEENLDFFLQLLESDKVESAYKKEIGLKLVQFYYENDRIKELDLYLEEVEASIFDHKERGEMLRFLVMRGLYEKAYEWIGQYGLEGIDPKILVRLCDRLIERDEYTGDELMCHVIMHAFRYGKYNEAMLNYLMVYFEGMTKELRNIWKAALAFELDNYEMTERILRQMLYTGSYVGEKMEIFKNYVAENGKIEMEMAFLAQGAYDYFVKEKVQEEYLFEEIMRLYRLGEEIPFICKLALTKYYAENKNEREYVKRDVDKCDTLEKFLTELVERGIALGYFKEYAEMFPMMKQFGDKTIIEYRAHPDAKAMLHYVIEKEEGDVGEYHTEELKNVFGGVCTKEFVLFFGETLQYYIIEERDGKGQLTESNAIQKSDIMEEEMQTRFTMINDMVISKTLQDYDTVDALLEEYFLQEYENDRLFYLQ